MTAPTLYSLLVVDDEPDLRTLYELTLLREGYDVETAGNVEDAWQHLQDRTYSAIITDMRLPDGTGLDLLRRIDAEGRREKAIVITAYGSAENAVEALKAGAYDYLTKPVDLRQFRAVVSSALGRTPSAALPTPASVQEPATTPLTAPPLALHRGARKAEATALSRMVGNSDALQHVRGLIDKVARSMAPVLVWGESGTGKELVARAIHDVSSRHQQPFIAVNCGAIPEQLLEAEFFGYRKGAFTGANEDREGFFQAAHGGSLFLDEIGDLPLSMQTKLLRVIQERAVRPVGAVAEVPVDVRIISATHKDLAAEVAAKRFRQDLFYRLNVIQIPLPALRERLEDLPSLCLRILERISAESGLSAVPQLGRTGLVALLNHPFPGNVRELENILHRAVTLSGHQLIEANDLGLPNAAPSNAEDIVTADFLTPSALLGESPVAQAAPPVTPAPQPAALPSDLVSHLDQVERDILVQALEKYRLNRTAAGASLSLSLRQMRYRMARLGVKVTDQGIVLGERFDPEADAE
ncbi:sigma-54 dependent transcriptional regulator [Aquabacterium sp. CECT 9606]|uniref:sigma-54-dependent transcriptional regulator n=1 Tax=Aquabacterium sp. CECT 9606 TaxID=2845822 RepID=UPI001E3AA612|nr:sigma-54 dependent transcriptional regulator [Aquabacterium sp. CECT 9606]CAH0349492.1 Transcriptional regulatory protein ZraR [Aquabacterium sp. CECT 9606]